MNITFTQCKQITDNLYGGDSLREIVEQLKDQPEWIEGELSIADIQAIQQGGCASGAYMPAVTYHMANDTMAKYGDDVMEYIKDYLGDNYSDLITVDTSWSDLAVKFLSTAVEQWCSQFDLDGVDWD